MPWLQLAPRQRSWIHPTVSRRAYTSCPLEVPCAVRPKLACCAERGTKHGTSRSFEPHGPECGTVLRDDRADTSARPADFNTCALRSSRLAARGAAALNVAALPSARYRGATATGAGARIWCRKAIAIVGLAVGTFATFLSLVGTFDLPWFITNSVAAFVAVVLGTISLVPKQRDRLTTVAAVLGVALGTLALAVQWWKVLGFVDFIMRMAG